MKSILFTICLISILGTININAQNFLWGRFHNNTFNNIIAATASDVTSNYGTRNAPGGTRFHRGVDISPIGATNVILAAPSGGTITNIINPGLMSIGILEILLDTLPDPNNPSQNLPQTSLRFLHIFSNGNLPRVNSGFRLETVNFNGQTYPVIIDLVNCRAFSRRAGLSVTCNGQPVSATNPAILTATRFEMNWPIAPMGNSGTYINSAGVRVNYAYHTHVSQTENGSHDHNSYTESINPFHDLRIGGPTSNMECRIRNRNLTPLININNGTLCEHNGLWNIFVPNYTNDTRTVVEGEVYLNGATSVPDPNNPTMPREDRYSNAFMNEALVELQIAKNDVLNFQLIQGRLFNSRFRIDPRGIEVIYPNSMRTQYGGTGENESGCIPYSYTTGIAFHPHDYYIMPDFYVRIHQNHVLGAALSLANYPWDARYRDGDYSIRTRVTNIDGVVITQNPSVTFDIDNFNPFIFGAKAYFSNGPSGQPIYERYWEFTTKGKINLGLRTSRQVPTPGNPGILTLWALSSEAMTWMKARIPGPFPNWVNGVKVGATDNFGRELYRFDMGASGSLTPSTCYAIEFDGTDLAGNQVLKYEIPADCKTATLSKTLPYRNGPSSWANPHAQGYDKVHFINLSPCGGNFAATDECTLTAEEVESTVMYASGEQSNGSVSLSITGEHPNLTFKWTDTNENVVSTSQNLANVPAGTYCIEIKEDCCIVSGCFEVGECQTEVIPLLTHPTAEAPNGGSIHLSMSGGEEPYTYQWANGQTGSDLTGLPVGSYCVTATDANGCQVVACPELIVCPTIIVNPTLVIEKPSSCTAQDGMVRVLSWGVSGTSQASYDYVFQSESGEVLQSTATGKYLNLASGIYTLLVTDQNNGCTGSYDINLLSEHYPDIEAFIFPACAGMPTGKVGVAALGSGYTFEWQDSEAGVVSALDDIYSELSGVYEGNYCVTISSDDSDCVVEKCYDIPGVLPESLLTASGVTTNPCPRSRNGAINLTVSGGIAPYTFDWNDVTNPEEEVEDRAGLAAGNFLVTVTDYCGASVALSFELSILEIESIVFTPGCEDEGSAAVSVVGGNAPYTYLWKNGGTTPTIQGLPSGEYCLTLTDAGGCSVAECTYGENKNVRILDITRPCIHLAQTGSITFEIYNPDNELVEIYNEGQLVSSQSTGGVFTFTLDNLSHSFDYHININIGDCLNSFTERMQSQLLTPVYNSYEENTGCIYDMYCNGELIAGEGYSSPPTLALANAISSPFNCEVERFCNENSLGWVSFSKKKVRAYEYLMILYGAGAAGFNSTYISQLIDTYFGKDLNNCDFVKYCPATLEIISTPLPVNIFNNNGDGTVTTINSNCDRLECGLFYDEVLCTSDIVPEIWNPNNIDLVDCDPRRYNVWQLMTWWPELIETYDGFEETDLGQKIQELSDIYYGITPTSVEPISVTCMFITFCSSDFTVLNTTDINSVICWDSQNPDLLGCAYSGEPYNVVVCINPITLTHYIVPIKQEFTGDLLMGPSGPELPHIFTAIEGSKDHFDKFGYIVNEGIVTPKGIFETTTGEKQFVDYTYRSMVLQRENAPKLMFYSDDWDNDELIFVTQTANDSLAIHFEGEENSWQKNLNATGYIKMIDIKKTTDEILLSGWFKGAFVFNDSLIGTASDSAGYLLYIGTDGLINKFNMIQNLSTNSELTIKQSNDGHIVSGVSKSDWIAIDNTAPITISDTKLFEISNAGGTVYEKKDNEIQTNGNIRLLKSVSSIDQTSTTMLLGGQGQVITTNETYKLNGKTLVLITMDSTGAIEWVKPIYSITSDKEIDITYGDSSNLYFAASFQDTLTIEDATFVSHGMKDICVGKISPNGSLLGVNQYGSDEDELVKQCFFDKGILYLGGDYSGLNETRTIGKKEFVKIGNNEDEGITKAFITYLTDEDIFPVTSFRSSSQPDRQVWVSPNPFFDLITIRLNSQRDGLIQVKLLDALGKELRIQRESVSVGNNTLYINRLNGIPSGVYFIQVINTDGKKWNQRLIKN